MKFSKTLENEAIPEWRIKYIDYKQLKKKLNLVKRTQISREKESNRTSLYRKNHESHHHSHPQSSSSSLQLPLPNTTKRNSCQSQKQKRRSSLISIVENANTLFHRFSWKINNISERQTVPENTKQGTSITPLDTFIDQVYPEEREFFRALEKELEKISLFYELQESEAIKRFSVLQQQLEKLKVLGNNNKNASGRFSGDVRRKLVKKSIDNILTSVAITKSAASPDKDISQDGYQVRAIDYKEAKRKIRKAIMEFYRGVKILDTYRKLNETGFFKILKKYDKISGRNGSQIYMPKVKNSNFAKSVTLPTLTKDIEKFYVKFFEGGSEQKAKEKLKLPNKKHETFNAASLRVGLYLGISIPIMTLGYNLAFSTQPKNWIVLMQLYVGILLPIIMSLLVGINIYVWNQRRINYKFIFEFDSRDNLDLQQYLEIPSVMFLATNIVIFLNFLNKLEFVNVNSYPLFLLLFFIVFLFCPYPTLYYKARRWFLFTMGRQIFCFYHRVEFRDFFIADILNSLSYSFTTIRLFPCLFDTTKCNDRTSVFVPFFGMFPAIIRMTHCLKRYHDTKKPFPHLANALKYFLTIIQLWALFLRKTDDIFLTRAFWFILQFIASFYAFLWDVSMDWTLFDMHSQNYLLRDHLVYGINWLYYVAIVTNFLLRMSWVSVTVYPNNLPVMFAMITGELVRRWIWNFFRVESEHINNCGKFRAIKETPLPFKIKPIIDDMKNDFVDNDMIIDEEVNSESINWFANLIKSNKSPRNNEIDDDWKDFESTKKDNEYSDDGSDNDDSDNDSNYFDVDSDFGDKNDDDDDDNYVDCLDEFPEKDQNQTA